MKLKNVNQFDVLNQMQKFLFLNVQVREAELLSELNLSAYNEWEYRHDELLTAINQLSELPNSNKEVKRLRGELESHKKLCYTDSKIKAQKDLKAQAVKLANDTVFSNTEKLLELINILYDDVDIDINYIEANREEAIRKATEGINNFFTKGGKSKQVSST